MSIYPRERITDALQDSAARGIAVLIAPAGFGKSEAVVDAFGEQAHFVQVPLDDSSVETLARLLIEKAAPRAARAIKPLLQRAPSDENRAHLVDWCAARLRDIEQPIVLEDFHRIAHEPATLRFIQTLIEATVPTTRFVLVSRELPELPLGTWLARDFMTMPLTIDDLSFEVAEGGSVAAAMRVDIDATSLDALVTDVGGWPLAMRLSLAAWERTRALPPLRIRTRGALFAFIEAEVWSNLTAAEQRFFNAAAHLAEVRPRILGAAGFAETHLTLERLHRRLPLLARLGNGAYRLHELFREFILERQQSDPAGYDKLVSQVARATERFGDIEEAIGMYIRARAWDAAIGLLSRHAIDRISSGRRAEIVAFLPRFPRAYLDHPVITGIRGYALALDGSADAGARELRTALKGDIDRRLWGALSLRLAETVGNTGGPAEAMKIVSQLMTDESLEERHRLDAASMLASVAALSGDRELARDAIGFCFGSIEAPSVELRALIRQRIAFAHFYLGETGAAEAYANEAAQLAHSVGLEAIAAKSYSILQAIALSTYADPVLARRYLELWAHSAVACGDKIAQVYALGGLVCVAADQADDVSYEAAHVRLSELGLSPQLRYAPMLRWAKVLYEVGRGNLRQAAQSLTSLDDPALSGATKCFRDALLAVLMAKDARDESAVLLSRSMIVPAERDLDNQRLLAHARTFAALGNWLIGRGRAARRMRSPDYSMLPPQDAAILTVIETICSTSRNTITARQLEQLTEPLIALNLSGHARFLRAVLAPAAVESPLTRTELDVLRELRGGGTTLDVADRMGRSSHTVLSHLKSACAKIGCSGRAAAVAYAVDRGWID